MRVLLTNITLGSRTGTEVNVRDVAVGLLRRGHEPVVYSPILGEIAEEIRAATVPVTGDLTRLGAPPDVIHAHHHTTAFAALQRFPGVPALFFVHDWASWFDEPLRSPRVALYVPVDATTGDRLTSEHGVPPERVRLLPNAVDLDRFRSRGPLPERPRKALAFGNQAGRAGYAAVVKTTCERAGIELDLLGAAAGRSVAEPERVLPEYDLVFAKGRSALEALATGCAVVLCDVAGLGDLVDSAGFERMRRLNFGRRCLGRPITVEGVGEQIARYDPLDAARVAARTRAEAGLELQLDRLERLYEEARRLHAAEPVIPAEEALAATRYLQRWLPRFVPPPRTGDDLASRWYVLVRDRIAEAEAARSAAADRSAADARHAAAMRAAEDARAEAERKLADAGRALVSIRGSTTWRVRSALLRRPRLAALARLVLRARGLGGDSG